MANSRRSRKSRHGNRSTYALPEGRAVPPSGGERTDVRRGSSREREPPGGGSASGGGVVLLESGRLIQVPNRTRHADVGLSERRREDRDAVTKLQDRLCVGGKHTFVQKVLRAHDTGGLGGLSRDEMRSALQRLNLGLSTLDVEKVISRLCPADGSRIPHNALLELASSFEPLGPRQMDDGQPITAAHPQVAPHTLATRALPTTAPAAAAAAAGSGALWGTGAPPAAGPANLSSSANNNNNAGSGSTVNHGCGSAASSGASNNARTRAPWEPLVGRMAAWNWEVRAQGLAGLTGAAEPGSYEQRKQDSLLISLLSQRLTQASEKLRLTFKKWDTSRNGQLSKEEFVAALSAMQLQVPPQQLERLFDMADVNSSGQVDYAEFIRMFDTGLNGTARRVNPAEEAAPRNAPLAATLEPHLEAAELEQAVRSPLTRELCNRLAAKASAAHAVFSVYDLNGDGHLSLQELTHCCQQLVHGVSERHVAALMTACDPSGDAYLNYREFVGRLVEDLTPAHPRMMDAHLAGNTLLASKVAAASHGTFHATADIAVQQQEQQGQRGTVARPTWGHSPLFTRSITPPSLCTAQQAPTGLTAQLHDALPTSPSRSTSASPTQRRTMTSPAGMPSSPAITVGSPAGPGTRASMHAARNTVWTPADLPAPGYTGTLQPHLRDSSPCAEAPADAHLRIHQTGVASMVASLAAQAMSDSAANSLDTAAAADDGVAPRMPPSPSKQRPVGGLPWDAAAQADLAALQAEEASPVRRSLSLHVAASAPVDLGVTAAAAAGDSCPASPALMPYDYDGAPPVPGWPPRRTRGQVPGARDVFDTSPATAEANLDHRQRRAVASRNLRPTTTLGIPPSALLALRSSMPELPVRYSGSSMHRCLTPSPRQPHGATAAAAAAAAADGAVAAGLEDDADEPKRTGKARFGTLSYPRTGHVCSVQPGTSQWAPPQDTWVRKHDAGFLAFQQQDKERTARKHDTAALKTSQRLAEEACRAAARDEQQATWAASRLKAQGMVAARYQERCAMAEVARAAHVPHASPLFNRALFFTDHQLIDPVLLTRGAQQ